MRSLHSPFTGALAQYRALTDCFAFHQAHRLLSTLVVPLLDIVVLLFFTLGKVVQKRNEVAVHPTPCLIFKFTDLVLSLCILCGLLGCTRRRRKHCLLSARESRRSCETNTCSRWPTTSPLCSLQAHSRSFLRCTNKHRSLFQAYLLQSSATRPQFCLPHAPRIVISFLYNKMETKMLFERTLCGSNGCATVRRSVGSGGGRDKHRGGYTPESNISL